MGQLEILPVPSDLQDNFCYEMDASILRIDAVAYPVIAVPEAATWRSQASGDYNILTSDYTFGRQIQIELDSDRMIHEASLLAAILARRLQPKTTHPKSAVLADRSALDGHVYAALRRPDENNDVVDLRTVTEETGGFLFGPGDYNLNIRHFARQAMDKACDKALVADHADIALEDNGLRIIDDEFRDRTAKALQHYYCQVLGTARVESLTGTREQRSQFLMSAVSHLLTA